jgi:hypothetical protein
VDSGSISLEGLMVETEETARKMDANLKKRAVRQEQTVQEELFGNADPDKARVVA